MDVDQPEDRFDSVAEALAARVKAIVQAAEEQAAAMQGDLEIQRQEAEAERRSYLAAARTHADSLARQRLDRLHALTEGLVDRAERCRRELDDLLGLLGEATGELRREEATSHDLATGGAVSQPPDPVAADPLGDPRLSDERPSPAPTPTPGPSPAPGPAPPHAAAPEPTREPGEPPPEPGEENEDLDAARLAAIQMAVAGSTREEVERHLRERFGVRSVDPILDDVFGTGSHGATRMSWGPA
jgi:hypothetical protein